MQDRWLFSTFQSLSRAQTIVAVYIPIPLWPWMNGEILCDIFLTLISSDIFKSTSSGHFHTALNGFSGLSFFPLLAKDINCFAFVSNKICSLSTKHYIYCPMRKLSTQLSVKIWKIIQSLLMAEFSARVSYTLTKALQISWRMISVSQRICPGAM